MNDDVQLVREIGEVKAELSGLKAEVAGTNQRLDDIVITQLKDHGKRLAALDVRIAALEAAENKRAGGLSVLAGVAAAAGSLCYQRLVVKIISKRIRQAFSDLMAAASKFTRNTNQHKLYRPFFPVIFTFLIVVK